MAGDAVSGDQTAPGGVRQALPWLTALDTVLADPARLVGLLQTVALDLSVTAPGSAVLVLDGAEHRFTAQRRVRQRRRP
jgi:hypothetical protein